jgi:hypothetical protein
VGAGQDSVRWVTLVTLIACGSPAKPHASLSYHGWHVGLPRDSVATLAVRETGDTLSCQGVFDLTSTEYCTAGKSSPSVTVQLIAPEWRLSEVNLVFKIGDGVTYDSLRTWLTTAWGAPDSTFAFRDRQPVIWPVTWLGSWNSGSDYARVYEMAVPDEGRLLVVTLADRVALLREEEVLGLRKASKAQLKP